MRKQENTLSYGRSLSIVWRLYLFCYPEETGTNKMDLRHTTYCVKYKYNIFSVLTTARVSTTLPGSTMSSLALTGQKIFHAKYFRCSVTPYDISVLLVIISRVMPCHCNNYHNITSSSRVFLLKICITVEQQLKLGEILNWVLCSSP